MNIFLGHAEELMRSTVDLGQKYAGLIIISGDGLVHEVVNGLGIINILRYHFIKPVWEKLHQNVMMCWV